MSKEILVKAIEESNQSSRRRTSVTKEAIKEAAKTGLPFKATVVNEFTGMKQVVEITHINSLKNQAIFYTKAGPYYVVVGCKSDH